MTKQCSVCGIEKDIWMGYYAKTHKQCIDCCRTKGKNAYLALTDQEKNERKRKWGVNERRLKRYRLTKEQFEEMLTLQGKRCAICRRDRKLNIDHCHSEGVVRGLLCHECNAGIGFLQDSIELLANAIDYLEKPTFKSINSPKTNPKTPLK